MPKKILTVVGARPQFIKAAMFSKIVHGDPSIQEFILHTGQHYDANMSEIFFREMNIPEPWRKLHSGGGTHAQMTAAMLIEIEKAITELNPDAVLVYGDTDSTLAGALAASKLHVPIIHVEAGLRSFNRIMPEEINRVLVDHLSSLLFCPTHLAMKHLCHEGIEKNVFHTGDIMFDSALQFSKIAEGRVNILSQLGIEPNEFILCTIHRAENTDDRNRLEAIIHGLQEVSKKHKIVLPLHPRTLKQVDQFGFKSMLSSMIVTEPLDFLSMVVLEKNAKVIATDSGGIQKEAYFHSTPCVTFRTETEWCETVDSGWNVLANPLTSIPDFIESAKKGSPIEEYGDGHAAEKILDQIHQFFGVSR